MKLVNMKLPKKKKKTDLEVAAPSQSEEYPYGLRLSFQEDEIKKLGLNLKKLKVEDAFSITGEAKVVEISQTESKNINNKRLELQITAIALSNKNSFEGGYKEGTET